MLSRFRQSFRRKSSKRRSRSGIEESDSESDTDTAYSSRSSVASSTASLNTSFSSLDSSLSSNPRRHRSVRQARPSSTVNAAAAAAAGAQAASSSSFGSSNTEWQKDTPSVVECNRTMFNRQLNCDVMFVVGESQALVGAHRYVLVSRSEVFYRMFWGPMAEDGERPIVIPDATEDIFRQFLEFLYVDEISLTPDNVTSMHYLGRKYDIESLIQQCLEFLHARLTCDNACSILEQAHCFDEHELYKTSFEFVKENVKACLASTAVHDLCRGCLEKLLSEDCLETSELQLFKAALNWAEASLEKKQTSVDADNVRTELGPALELIRFPAMSHEILNQRVFPTRILTHEEVKAIMEYKHTGQCTSLRFETRGRLRVVDRFQNVSRVRCHGRLDGAPWTAAITFSCDKDLLLHGIHVFSCTRNSTHRANVQFSILQGQDEIDSFNRVSDDHRIHTYNYNGTNDGMKSLVINISPPRKLVADLNYTVVVQASMASCFAGTDGMASATRDDVTFRFRDSKIKFNGTTVTEGQIPCLVYSVR